MLQQMHFRFHIGSWPHRQLSVDGFQISRAFQHTFAVDALSNSVTPVLDARTVEFRPSLPIERFHTCVF